MQLIGDRIAVIAIKEEEVTQGGIILPTKSRKNPIGKIVKIGIKVKHLKVGDTVMYHDNVGITINYKGDDLLLLSETRDIISTI